VSSSKNKDIQPYWRPNYRNSATLPDIKVIRTDFIVNFVSIVVVLAILGFNMQREYRAWSLGSTVSDIKQQILLAEPDDSIYLKQSENFRKAGRYVQDLERFYKSPFYAHELIVALSELKDDDLILGGVKFSESIVKVGKKTKAEYRINLNGDVRDLPTLDDYVVSIRNSDIFDIEGYETKVSENPLQLDTATGLYPYSISITLSPAVPQKKGKKK